MTATATDTQARPGYRIPYPDDPFEVRAGPFWTPDVPEPDGTVTLAVERRHCNGSGVVHGGLLATMADLAVCWVAVMDLADERVVTVSLNTEYLAAALEGDILVATPELVRRTGSLAFARCEIRARNRAEDGAEDRDGGRVVATASAVLKRMRRTPR